MSNPLTLPPLLVRLLPLLAQLEQPVYLVGGAVRDLLLGRPVHDFDFALARDGIATAFRIGNALGRPAYALDDTRDIGRVVLADAETYLDFASYRIANAVGGLTLTDDLRDRDYTINALALPLRADGPPLTTADVIDPTGGLADLAARRIRQTHPAALLDDPLRALRAVRQAQALGFTIEPLTAAALQQAALRLPEVSAERIRDEFGKLLSGPQPDRALADMHTVGLLAVVVPELLPLIGVTQSPPHREDVFDHTLSVLRWLTYLEAAIDADVGAPDAPFAWLAPYAAALRDYLATAFDGGVDGRLLLRLAAVLHDTGKPATRTIDESGRIRFFEHELVGSRLARGRVDALHFSRAAGDHVVAIVRHHMRPLLLAGPTGASRRAVYRFFKATGAAGVAVALHALADHTGKSDGAGDPAEWQQLQALVGQLLTHYFERYEETIRPPRLIDGRELMQLLGVKPGRLIGQILAAVEEAQAIGEIDSREAALAFAGRFAQATGAADPPADDV